MLNKIRKTDAFLFNIFTYFFILLTYFLSTKACENSADTMNTYLQHVNSTLFTMIQEDLHYESKEESFLDCLKTTKLYYFTKPNECIECTLDIPNASLYNNPDELFTYILNAPWPIPIPFFFTYQKLFEPLLIAQKTIDIENSLPLLNYINNQDECTLFTILYNYNYFEIKADVHIIHHTIIKEPNSLVKIIGNALIKNVCTKEEYRSEYNAILKKCLLSKGGYYTGKKEEIEFRYSKQNVSINKISQLLIKKYPALAISKDTIEYTVQEAMQYPQDFLEKMIIKNNHLDLSNLDLSIELLKGLYHKDERENHYDPYPSLIHFDNQIIESSTHFPGAFGIGAQPYKYDYWLLFQNITKLSLTQNPHLTKLPINELVHCFPELTHIVIDAKNIEKIKQSMQEPDNRALIGFRRHNCDGVGTRLHATPCPLKITVYKADQNSKKHLENIYKNAYKDFFFYDNYLNEIHKEIFSLSLTILLFNSIISCLLEGTIENLFVPNVTIPLLGSGSTLFVLSCKEIKKYKSNKNAFYIISYWLLSRLFFIFSAYISIAYYIKQINTKNTISINLIIGIGMSFTMLMNTYIMHHPSAFDKAIAQFIKNRSFLPNN